MAASGALFVRGFFGVLLLCFCDDKKGTEACCHGNTGWSCVGSVSRPVEAEYAHGLLTKPSNFSAPLQGFFEAVFACF